MTIEQLWNIIRISLIKNRFQRAKYCFWQPRNIPLEAKLIKLRNNVVIN